LVSAATLEGLADPAATKTAPAAIAAPAASAIACFLLITWISFRIRAPGSGPGTP
jgi:hypothetical protein